MLLVIGGGFLGCTLALHFARRDQRVTLYSRSFLSSASRELRMAGVTICPGELLDRASLSSVIAGAEVVFYFASTTRLSDPIVRLPDTLAAETRALVNTLEMMEEHSVSRIIFASSGGAIYGNAAQLPTPEATPLAPLSSYGWTKATMEGLLALAHRDNGVGFDAVRIANPYGALQLAPRLGVIARMLMATQLDEIVQVRGNGKAVRDYLFSADLATGIEAIWRHGPTNQAINLGTGIGTSLVSLVSAIERVTNRKVTLRIDPQPKYDVAASTLDISLISRLTGWRPSIGLDDGVAALWASLNGPGADHSA